MSSHAQLSMTLSLCVVLTPHSVPVFIAITQSNLVAVDVHFFGGVQIVYCVSLLSTGQWPQLRPVCGVHVVCG